MAQSRNKLNQFLLSKNGDLVRQALAEFLGSAILVLFACGACVATSSFGDLRTNSSVNMLMIALTFGLTVMALAQSLGHVSGCHVNPAVTVGLLVNGQIDIIRAVVYIIAQLVGAVAGAGLLAGVVKTGAQNLCPTALHIDPFQGIIVEAAITFVLVFVVCNACESNGTLAPVTIGLAVSVGHLFAIPLTSSSMNSARSFGPALVQGFWRDHWVYWVGPLIGGALGGLAHRFLFWNKSQMVVLPDSEKANGETSDVTTNV